MTTATIAKTKVYIFRRGATGNDFAFTADTTGANLPHEQFAHGWVYQSTDDFAASDEPRIGGIIASDVLDGIAADGFYLTLSPTDVTRVWTKPAE
jgi:hypothetical protein